jgi:hypothetical protein
MKLHSKESNINRIATILTNITDKSWELRSWEIFLIQKNDITSIMKVTGTWLILKWTTSGGWFSFFIVCAVGENECAWHIGHYLVKCTSPGWWMWNGWEQSTRNILTQCLFVRHKSHLIWPGNEPQLRWLEASQQPPCGQHAANFLRIKGPSSNVSFDQCQQFLSHVSKHSSTWFIRTVLWSTS